MFTSLVRYSSVWAADGLYRHSRALVSTTYSDLAVLSMILGRVMIDDTGRWCNAMHHPSMLRRAPATRAPHQPATCLGVAHAHSARCKVHAGCLVRLDRIGQPSWRHAVRAEQRHVPDGPLPPASRLVGPAAVPDPAVVEEYRAARQWHGKGGRSLHCARCRHHRAGHELNRPVGQPDGARGHLWNARARYKVGISSWWPDVIPATSEAITRRPLSGVASTRKAVRLDRAASIPRVFPTSRMGSGAPAS